MITVLASEHAYLPKVNISHGNFQSALNRICHDVHNFLVDFHYYSHIQMGEKKKFKTMIETQHMQTNICVIEL